MKALLAMASIGAAVSCSKESASLLDESEQSSAKTEVHVMDMATDINHFVVVPFETLASGNVATGGSRAPGAHARGTFSALGVSFKFSAMANNSGVKGSIDISSSAGTVHAEAICIVSEEDQAVVGGLITESSWLPSFPTGSSLYFHVRDNGSGAHAPADQWHTQIYIVGGSGPLCSLLPPSNTTLWPPSGWVNVSGSIQVH